MNEEFSILESTIALGDYYYNSQTTYKEALREYFKAKRIGEHLTKEVDISIVERRINDMKLRMNEEDFIEIENKYGK